MTATSRRQASHGRAVPTRPKVPHAREQRSLPRLSCAKSVARRWASYVTRLFAYQQIQRTLCILIIYLYFLDGILLLMLIRVFLVFQLANPNTLASQRSLPRLARYVSAFHLWTTLGQQLSDTLPTRSHLLLNFVGEEHAASKWHLLAIDLAIWCLQLIMLVMTYEETLCREFPERCNALDITDEELAASALCEGDSHADSDFSEEGPTDTLGDSVPLLGQRATAQHKSKEGDTALPTIRYPIAIVRIQRLWDSSDEHYARN